MGERRSRVWCREAMDCALGPPCMRGCQGFPSGKPWNDIRRPGARPCVSTICRCGQTESSHVRASLASFAATEPGAECDGWIADGAPAAPKAASTSPAHLLLQSNKLPSTADDRVVPFRPLMNIRPFASEKMQMADHVRPPEPDPLVATTRRAPPTQSEKLTGQALPTDHVSGRAIPMASQSRTLALT